MSLKEFLVEYLKNELNSVTSNDDVEGIQDFTLYFENRFQFDAVANLVRSYFTNKECRVMDLSNEDLLVDRPIGRPILVETASNATQTAFEVKMTKLFFSFKEGNDGLRSM